MDICPSITGWKVVVLVLFLLLTFIVDVVRLREALLLLVTREGRPRVGVGNKVRGEKIFEEVRIEGTMGVIAPGDKRRQAESRGGV